MGLMENIRLAISSLKANKLRALLTMLGIIIGIASVITIVTIGDSLAASINSEMSGFGARNINMYIEQKTYLHIMKMEKKFIQNMKLLQKRILLQMK